MTAIESYRNLCDSEPSIPLFSQAWWLDAVCGEGHWDVVLVERGGGIQATMPYYKPDRWSIRMPKLTQTMGPWIRPGEGKYTSQLSREMELMAELIEQLPPVHVFKQNFHHSITNWLPFYWKNYKQTTRYTYVLSTLVDLDGVWDNLSSKHVRSPIRKAERDGLHVVDGCSLEEFFVVNDMTFKRQKMQNPISRRLVQRVWSIAHQRNAATILVARDAATRIHAVSFLVWNSNCCYYLIGGADPDLRASGAQNLVIWESIKFASTVSKSFDFEGSMLPSVENSVRRFGAVQYPYSSVTRCTASGRVMSGCIPLLRRVKRFFRF